MSGVEQGMYPLRFKEILRNYGFGDRWIVREFKKTDLPEDHRVGETWEVCDRPGESSKIVNGWMQGKTLRQAIDECGAALMGRAIAERFGTQFPLQDTTGIDQAGRQSANLAHRLYLFRRGASGFESGL